MRLGAERLVGSGLPSTMPRRQTSSTTTRWGRPLFAVCVLTALLSSSNSFVDGAVDRFAPAQQMALVSCSAPPCSAIQVCLTFGKQADCAHRLHPAVLTLTFVSSALADVSPGAATRSSRVWTDNQVEFFAAPTTRSGAEGGGASNASATIHTVRARNFTASLHAETVWLDDETSLKVRL